MANLSYTAPQARRVRLLAKNEEFQGENGPNHMAIAHEVGLSKECVTFILDGTLPGGEPVDAPQRAEAEETEEDPLE